VLSFVLGMTAFGGMWPAAAAKQLPKAEIQVPPATSMVRTEGTDCEG
jgi:hypothetical protein